MRRIPTTCLDCGTPQRHGSRCVLCDRAYQRRRRNSPALRGYDAAYRRDRLAVIGGPCELRISPNCTGYADTADHVVPVSRGGQHGPLRGACKTCNSARGNRPSYVAGRSQGLESDGSPSPRDTPEDLSVNPEPIFAGGQHG